MCEPAQRFRFLTLPSLTLQEAKRLQAAPVAGISVAPSETNALEWLVHIDGPATYMPPNATAERPSPYAGRRFAVKVTFPDTYPFKAPVMSFREGVMWHPIVSVRP